MRFELEDLYSEIDKQCENIIDRKTDRGLKKLKELTPEDTFDLQNDNQRSEVIRVGSKLKTRIFNDNDHVEYVEYSKKVKKYYKNSGRKNGGEAFTTGKGAGMFRKTQFYLENE